MASVTVLLIGPMELKKTSYATLEKRYRIVCAPSGKKGLEMIRQNPARIVIVDAESMRSSGVRVCQTLREQLPANVFLIHILAEDQKIESPADIVLCQPLTSRKLINIIERLIHSHQDTVVSHGPFSMNLTSRILHFNGAEIQLSPKLATLVEIFLCNPGQVMDRKVLMAKVWETEYMGDTRTLDVHIRWIREAIEVDPRHPQFLKTVRGVGYRLEVEPVPEPQR